MDRNPSLDRHRDRMGNHSFDINGIKEKEALRDLRGFLEIRKPLPSHTGPICLQAWQDKLHQVYRHDL